MKIKHILMRVKMTAAAWVAWCSLRAVSCHKNRFFPKYHMKSFHDNFSCLQINHTSQKDFQVTIDMSIFTYKDIELMQCYKYYNNNFIDHYA